MCIHKHYWKAGYNQVILCYVAVVILKYLQCKMYQNIKMSETPYIGRNWYPDNDHWLV